MYSVSTLLQFRTVARAPGPVAWGVQGARGKRASGSAKQAGVTVDQPAAGPAEVVLQLLQQAGGSMAVTDLCARYILEQGESLSAAVGVRPAEYLQAVPGLALVKGGWVTLGPGDSTEDTTAGETSSDEDETDHNEEPFTRTDNSDDEALTWMQSHAEEPPAYFLQAVRSNWVCGFGSALEWYWHMRRYTWFQLYLEKQSAAGLEPMFISLARPILRGSAMEQVWHLIEDIRQVSGAPTSGFYEQAMKTLGSRKALAVAVDMFHCMRADGVAAHPNTASCALSFMVELGRVDEAVALVTGTQFEGHLTIRGFTAILKAIPQSQPDWVVQLVECMEKRGVPRDTLFINMALRALGLAGATDEALQLYEKIQGQQPDLLDNISHNTLSKILTAAGRRGEAADLCRQGGSPLVEKSDRQPPWGARGQAARSPPWAKKAGADKPSPPWAAASAQRASPPWRRAES